MDDKKLLELSAKAEGRDLTESFWGGGRDGFYWVKEDQPVKVQYWNPLNDDGDALRLAVKLDIEIYQADDDGPAIYAGYWGKPERRDVTRMFCIEPINTDPYAATRRAIVRAAAEIGRNMP